MLIPIALSSSNLKPKPTQLILELTSHSAVDAVNSLLGSRDKPAGFQNAVVASFATAVKAPPIPVARGPTGIVKKSPTVVPTLVCGNKLNDKPKKIINNIFFILISIIFTGNQLLYYCQFTHFFIAQSF